MSNLSERENVGDNLNSTKIENGNSSKNFWNLYGGIFMALSASVFFSSSFLVIKLLEHHGLKPFGSALLFNIGVVVPCLILIILNEFAPGSKKRSRVLNGIWPITKESVLSLMMVKILNYIKYHLHCFLK